jgi:hypothetical protein
MMVSMRSLIASCDTYECAATHDARGWSAQMDGHPFQAVFVGRFASA